MKDSIFIGLDVHKATITRGERGSEVCHWGTIPNRADHVRKLSEKLGGDNRQLHFCYATGPCGYGLHRQLTKIGHDCMVVAPSLIPVKAGDRVKTDWRDAIMLAKLHRAGELTAVWVPDSAHEAMRDLIRAGARPPWGSPARRVSICRASSCGTAGSIPKVVATTAIAPEMAGFIWAIARTVTSARA